jgi:hypothetical protein
MNADERAWRDLRVLRGMIGRLRSIPDGDDDDSVRERMALRAEWNNVVNRVGRLDAAAQQGELSAHRVVELGDVARELTTLLPQIKARRYHLPDFEALKRAADRPASAPIP